MRRVHPAVDARNGELVATLWHAVGQSRQVRTAIYHLLPAAALLALTAFAVVQGQAPYPSARYSFMDQNRYVAMAQHPFGTDPLVGEPPFAWRLLSPLVVYLLPLPVTTGFWLLTVVSLIATTYALRWFLIGLHLPRSAALAGSLAFVFLAPATGFTLWDYMLNDPLSFALLAAALGCVAHRRGPWLFVALILGVINKEVNIVAAVFAVAWAVQQRDRTMFTWSLGGAAAALAALVAIHVAIPTSSSYSLWQMFLEQTVRIGGHAKLDRLFQGTVFSWIVMLPLAALQLVHAPRVWRWPAFTLLLIGVVAQPLVATDVGRLVIYAFPVVIAATAFEIEYLARRFAISRYGFWTPLLVCELSWWLVTYQPDPSTWALPYPLVNIVLELMLPLTVALVLYYGGKPVVQRIVARPTSGAA